MSQTKDQLPNLDPRRKAPKRYFGNLIMPKVAHPAGAIPEALESRSNPESRRLAIVLLSAVGGLVLCGLLAIAIRGWTKPQANAHSHCGTEPSRDPHKHLGHKHSTK